MTYAAKPSDEMYQYLINRRSVSVKNLGSERPNDDEITKILQAGARSPDHGKMFPWYFIVIKDEARSAIGQVLRDAYLADEDAQAYEAKLELEFERFLRAPLVIMVVSRMRDGKHPLWEQFLSAGAVCMNMSLACHALGYGVNWLTEWYSYSPTFRARMGLNERDNIAGVMYIGNVIEQPEDRDRPPLSDIVTYWDGHATPLKKGDALNKAHGKGLPALKVFMPDDIKP